MKRLIFSVLRAGNAARLLLLVATIMLSLWASSQTITLNGSGTDPEGSALTYRWRLISGPGTVTFSPSALVAKPTVTATWAVGVYKFELEVTDPGGLKGLDTMLVTVDRANASPKANAGPDQTITLPASIAVIGQPDAPGLTVQWVRVSGPNATIKFPTQSITDITGLTNGSYVFRKIVTAANGLTGSDDVVVTVKRRCSWWMWWC